MVEQEGGRAGGLWGGGGTCTGMWIMFVTLFDLRCFLLAPPAGSRRKHAGGHLLFHPPHSQPHRPSLCRMSLNYDCISHFS